MRASDPVEPVVDLRPVIAETKRANVALMLMGAVCPKEVYPPAEALQFCTTAYAGGYDSRATLAFIKETAKEPVRIGFAAMAIPLSRGEIDYAEEQAKTMGMTPVDKEVIPPPTADYTPFATKLKDANPNWIFSWAPWVTQVKTFEALRRLGWQGDYITWAHIEAEGELARSRTASSTSSAPTRCSRTTSPIHKLIIEEAKKGNVRYPAEQLTEGWIGGLVLEAVLKRGLAGRCREDPRRDGEREGRYAGPARRPDRVEQGQPFPHPPVLSGLPLGPREVGDRHHQGLGTVRREVTGTPCRSSRGARSGTRTGSRTPSRSWIPGSRTSPAPRNDPRKRRSVQLIVNIIVLSAIYALLACGYVLIYRVSRVMNMAHGELTMLGAYLLFTSASLFVGNPLTAIAVAVVLSLTVGVLVYVLLMRKMTGEMVLAAILTTIAIGILLRGLIVLIWSAAQQHPLGARLLQSLDRAHRRRADFEPARRSS